MVRLVTQFRVEIETKMKIYIAKIDDEIDVDVEALPAVSLEYIIRYGLTQSLSDAAASVSNEDIASEGPGKAKGLINKRLDKIVAGEPPALVGRVGGNPVRSRAIEIALAQVIKPRWSKAGKKQEPKAMRQEASELVKKNPAYMHLAERYIAQEAEDAAFIELQAAEDVANAMEGLEEKAA